MFTLDYFLAGNPLWEDNTKEWTGLELADSQRAVESRTGAGVPFLRDFADFREK